MPVHDGGPPSLEYADVPQGGIKRPVLRQIRNHPKLRLERAAPRYYPELSLLMGLPLLRAGFPQYDLVGGYARAWVGYRGSRQALFDLANLVLQNHEHITPRPSRFAVRPRDAAAAPAFATGH